MKNNYVAFGYIHKKNKDGANNYYECHERDLERRYNFCQRNRELSS